MKCSKCGCSESLTKHHVYPRCFSRGRPNNTVIYLCEDHHCKLELMYMAVESFVGGVQFGTRFKLKADQYWRIVRAYLRTSQIVHAEFQREIR